MSLKPKGLPVKSSRGFGFETEVFGRSAEGTHPEYLEYSVALNEVLIGQPFDWNPFSPRTKIGHSLYWHTKKHLGRLPLGLYVAVGTALDRYHHTDGLFYLGDPSTDSDWFHPRRRVSIDLSIAKPGTMANLRLERSDVTRGRLVRIGGAVAAYLLGHIPIDELRTIT